MKINTGVTFNQTKNTKALAWTVIIHAILLVIFLTVRYKTYTSPALDDFSLDLVANLGTTDNGLGIDQPELMEDPAPLQEASPAQQNEASNTNEPTGSEAGNDDENTDVNATQSSTAEPVIRRTRTEKPKENTTTPINRTSPTNLSMRATQQTSNNANASNATTRSNAPNPKYAYPGGTGKGGNSASQNKPGGSEGIGTGDGDMGTPAGSPTGLSYSGGVSGRKIVAQPSNTAEFRNGGRVSVKVWVDRNGNIIRYNILSAANSTIRAIADQKIKGIRFNKEPNAPVEQNGIIVINFRAGTGR